MSSNGFPLMHRMIWILTVTFQWTCRYYACCACMSKSTRRCAIANVWVHCYKVKVTEGQTDENRFCVIRVDNDRVDNDRAMHTCLSQWDDVSWQTFGSIASRLRSQKVKMMKIKFVFTSTLLMRNWIEFDTHDLRLQGMCWLVPNFLEVKVAGSDQPVCFCWAVHTRYAFQWFSTNELDGLNLFQWSCRYWRCCPVHLLILPSADWTSYFGRGICHSHSDSIF